MKRGSETGFLAGQWGRILERRSGKNANWGEGVEEGCRFTDFSAEDAEDAETAENRDRGLPMPPPGIKTPRTPRGERGFLMASSGNGCGFWERPARTF